MSDLYLTPTSEGGDITLTNGRPQTTSSLEVAVYLSLFTPAYWGNLTAEQNERYTSTLADLYARRLTTQTLRDLEVAAENALAWMISTGVAERVIAEATLMSKGQVDYAYAVNWDQQEAVRL